MFYLECRDQFEESSVTEHIELCMGKNINEMSAEEYRFGEILYPLCKFNDTVAYKEALDKYIKFLDELIPKLMEISINTMQLKVDDLAFGYFCFEVHSE